MNKILIHFLLFLLSFKPQAQNTVGAIMVNQELVYPGYNLIFPHNQPHVYLFDNCGQLINIWEDEAQFRPGNIAYLLENGNLIKCKRRNNSVSDPIWAGGGGEIIEIRDWSNNLLHEYTLNDSLFRLHHDIAPMPNGNILLVAWEKKTRQEALEAGRRADLLPQDQVWSEVILEWNPTLDSIVWEWHVWDHLIQEHNPNAENYGVITNHPELINLNFDSQEGHPDWLHINAIDYNPVLDQILLSVPHFDEFWIINHNLTSEAAKGRSGDLLYRWGNPAAYRRGNPTNQKLFFQHDTHWVNPNAQSSEVDFGKIALFNNRVTSTLSTSNVLDTHFDNQTKTYLLENTFLPVEFERTILHPKGIIQSASNSVSSVQVLPNGNVLIFAGRWGYAYELTDSNEIVWEYVVPLKAGSPVGQGEVLSINQNITFRLKRYGLDHPAFQERDMTPKNFIEKNPNPVCEQISSANKFTPNLEISYFPNPASKYVRLQAKDGKQHHVTLFDELGRRVNEMTFTEMAELSLQSLSSGVYFLKFDYSFVRVLLVE
jgi:hypothetical protein